MLTYCDMTTSPDGELVPVQRRLAEIHHRYGPGHLVGRSIQRATPIDTPAHISSDAPARAGRMTRFARAVRTRWRTLFLVTGAVLTVLGVVLASGAVLLPGILLLLFALLHGIGSSGCTSADLLAGWPRHG